MYISPVEDIITAHNLETMTYADDTQIYVIFKQSDVFSVLTNLEKCIADVKAWMIQNKLKLNDTKTELMHATSRFIETDVFPPMVIGTSSIEPASEARTNETGPLPLCTFSVMGLSMCSSIFSESSPVRSKSGIINELSGFPNSVPTVRCSYTSSNWHGHTGHAYCICFVGKH